MKEIWKKYKLWIIIFMYAGMLALIVNFVILNLMHRTQEISDEIHKKNIDKELMETRISEIPKMEKRHNLFEEKKYYLSSILEINNEVEFIKKIEILAEETNNQIELSIKGNTLNESEKRTMRKAVNIKEDIKMKLIYDKYLIMDVTLRGEYEDFLNFVKKLENFQNYVNIIGFNMSKQNEEVENSLRNSNNFSGKVQLNTGGIEEKRFTNKEILVSVIEIVVYLR